MPSTLRGADIVVRTLERAGHTDIFTLSGNHIMSLFDAAIETKLSLMHVRHEAATVHMADAYGRLTGRPGIAWVTGGPGHANAVGALFTALGQETPMVLLSGHTETDQLGPRRIPGTASGGDGRAGLQSRLDGDGHRHGRAWMWRRRSRLATSGRPGPVHLSLPSDVLDATVPRTRCTGRPTTDFAAPAVPLADAAADAILALAGDGEAAAGDRRAGAGDPLRARSAAPDRGHARRPDLPQRRTARLQRRQPGRLRRCRQARRHGPAAGQGARFHA